MSVAYGVSTFIPYVCAVYACRCGRRAIRHGREAGSPPRGWQEGAEGRHACESCVQKATAAARPRT